MNADNISTDRQASAVEEALAFITHFEVEAMLRKEKKKAYVASVCLDLKPPYSAKVVVKHYPMGYTVPWFQRFDCCKGNTWCAS